VSWKSIDNGDEYTRESTDVDQGYSFYEDMQKSAGAYRVTWEQIPRRFSKRPRSIGILRCAGAGREGAVGPRGCLPRTAASD
jgi:hypothetical protein